ncbi:MBL fold metallo-hydrolase [Alicyclobacillus acidiphilus]|uniref:MBL fold metallo-hydrolase n=2 Tax=Alicyclobacillus acidiphilus TaxID=182455 RepID=UPI0008348955|nr:MBL fold metallo-hydrolase [Alicyclobacillus acidiphilus]
MKIANGVEVLELTMNMMGQASVIHPTLLWDEQEVILVDTGIPGQREDIAAAMSQAGVSIDALTKVILTHQDIDHIGSLPEILKSATKPVEVLAHAEDKPYIEGDKPSLKMTPERVAKMLESLPEDARQKVQAMFGTPITAKVDRTIGDGEVLPYCGGISVIFTPGHTPGHVSLYHQPSKTLITGDALVAANGELLGPNPQATPDMEMALRSLKKFTEYDISTVICYHGGVYTNNPNARLAELANG